MAFHFRKVPVPSDDANLDHESLTTNLYVTTNLYDDEMFHIRQFLIVIHRPKGSDLLLERCCADGLPLKTTGAVQTMKGCDYPPVSRFPWQGPTSRASWQSHVECSGRIDADRGNKNCDMTCTRSSVNTQARSGTQVARDTAYRCSLPISVRTEGQGPQPN